MFLVKIQSANFVFTFKAADICSVGVSGSGFEKYEEISVTGFSFQNLFNNGAGLRMTGLRRV